MGLLNSVPREQYEADMARWERLCAQWEARYDTLFAAYERLRPTHSPSTPIRTTLPREEPGTATLHAIEASLSNPRLHQMADSLQAAKPELSRDAALREAKRMDDILRGKAVAPSVAPPSEPPSR